MIPARSAYSKPQPIYAGAENPQVPRTAYQQIAYAVGFEKADYDTPGGGLTAGSHTISLKIPGNPAADHPLTPRPDNRPFFRCDNPSLENN